MNKHSKIKTVLLIRNFKSLNRNIFANVYIYIQRIVICSRYLFSKNCAPGYMLYVFRASGNTYEDPPCPLMSLLSSLDAFPPTIQIFTLHRLVIYTNIEIIYSSKTYRNVVYNTLFFSQNLIKSEGACCT